MDIFNSEGFAEYTNQKVEKNETVLNDIKPDLTKDLFVKDVLLKGEDYLIVGGVVEKMKSMSRVDEYVVFKPVDKQRDYPRVNGEVWIRGETFPNREVAVYVVSDEMGFDLVPETVYRKDIENGGSVQRWVIGENCDKVDFNEINKDELVKIAVFYHIIGAIDGHKKNFIRTPENEIKLIDNSLSFPEEEVGFYSNYEVTNFVKDTDIPEDLLNKMRKYVDENGSITESGDKMLTNLKEYITEEEARMVFVRMKSLLTSKLTPNPFATGPIKKGLPF